MNNIEIIKKILEINEYSSLNPVQEKASKYIGENTIVCSPTASGKTTIFELYLLDTIINRKKKVVYISPLKALTSEHYFETRRKFSKEFGLRIGLSTGDLDESVKHLEEYDVLFLTYEKFDSVIRHSPTWLSEVGLLTIDEIHEIGSDRGSTLEVLLTQVKINYPEIKVLGLSATIGNPNEIASWLSAKLIKSDYRPVPLLVGVLYDNKMYFGEQVIKLENIKKDHSLNGIIKDTLLKQKQIIVFCNSRKSTMTYSEKYSREVYGTLTNQEKEKLKVISKEVHNALETPTKQCTLLSNVLGFGVCFHHAGLVSKQRHIIEEEFKKGNIKVIFATPTLAAGINLPAFRVVINSIYRFDLTGSNPLSVNEVLQMVGRAGRPKYDKAGEALIVASKETDINRIYGSYIDAEPSNIDSQLSKINKLRAQLLSIIITNNIESIEEINKFISKTFYYKIFGSTSEIKENIKDIVNEFIEYEFVERIDKSKIKITDLGRKVSLLYLDPTSAHRIIEDLIIKQEKLENLNDLSLLFTLLNTTELSPYLNYKNEKEDGLFVMFEDLKQTIFFDYEDIYLLSKLYEAKMLNDWINETSEDKIIEEYNTSPGQIRDVLTRSEWIIHCILELCKFTGKNIHLFKKFKDLRTRLKYGVSEELVSLVELKNIGRVRARILFSRGMKSPNDIKKDPDKFISIIGRPGLVTLEELNIDYKKKIEEREEASKPIETKNKNERKKREIEKEKYKKQTSLNDY